MATIIDKYAGKPPKPGAKRWQVRWRENGVQRSKAFTLKTHAQNFIKELEYKQQTGEWINKEHGKILFEELFSQWLSTLVVRQTSIQKYSSDFKNMISPYFGKTPIGKIDRQFLQAWVAELSKAYAASSVKAACSIVSSCFNLAVDQGWLPKNPAVRLSLPKIPDSKRRYLTRDELERIFAASPGHLLPVVQTLVTTGIRVGELIALNVEDFNPVDRTLSISKTQTDLGVNPPKSGKNRVVPVIDSVAGMLEELCKGRAGYERLFRAPRGGRLRNAELYKVWNRTLIKAGVEKVTLHELRHTAASVAIASGADVKLVQRMLGHSKASMTLDVYAHLFEDRVDEVRQVMDSFFAPFLVNEKSTGKQLV